MGNHLDGDADDAVLSRDVLALADDDVHGLQAVTDRTCKSNGDSSHLFIDSGKIIVLWWR